MVFLVFCNFWWNTSYTIGLIKSISSPHVAIAQARAGGVHSEEDVRSNTPSSARLKASGGPPASQAAETDFRVTAPKGSSRATRRRPGRDMEYTAWREALLRPRRGDSRHCQPLHARRASRADGSPPQSPRARPPPHPRSSTCSGPLYPWL